MLTALAAIGALALVSGCSQRQSEDKPAAEVVAPAVQEAAQPAAAVAPEPPKEAAPERPKVEEQVAEDAAAVGMTTREPPAEEPPASEPK
jgi:PBP1b-binding outer membrane lipoprotein LpoB